MKRSIRMLLGVSVLCVGAIYAQQMFQSFKEKLPAMPSFSVPSLTTPEAVTNAVTKLSSAFNYLSKKTLKRVQKRQTAKLEDNLEEYTENPTLANGAKAIANVLAATAATVAEAGKE